MTGENEQKAPSADSLERKLQTLAGLRFFLTFECPQCLAVLDYAQNSRIESETRFLFCECGWQKEVPLPSRFVNYSKEACGFTFKWGAKKTTRAIRITQEAWDHLDAVAYSYGVNRADLLECWARALRDDEVSAYALSITIGRPRPGEIVKPRPGDAVLSPKTKGFELRKSAPPPKQN